LDLPVSEFEKWVLQIGKPILQTVVYLDHPAETKSTKFFAESRKIESNYLNLRLDGLNQPDFHIPASVHDDWRRLG
jgi:hypothetical protein